MSPEFLVFDPDGTFKLLWDIFCMLLIFYEILAIPLEISFSITISDTWEVFVDVAFFIDIFFNFNTGYYEQGIVQRDHERIMYNYLSLWFWIDLSASFPYNRVIEAELSKSEDSGNGSESYQQHRKMLRLKIHSHNVDYSNSQN